MSDDELSFNDALENLAESELLDQPPAADMGSGMEEESVISITDVQVVLYLSGRDCNDSFYSSPLDYYFILCFSLISLISGPIITTSKTMSTASSIPVEIPHLKKNQRIRDWRKLYVAATEGLTTGQQKAYLRLYGRRDEELLILEVIAHQQVQNSPAHSTKDSLNLAAPTPADPWEAVLVDTEDSEEDPAEGAILPVRNRLMNTQKEKCILLS